MKQYMVIGAGRFGVSVAKTLIREGQEVMLVDGSEEVVQQLSEDIENIAIVDVADEMALKNAGLNNFDVAIVAIGTDLRASIMATLIAKESGVPYVISKAKDKLQAQVLHKIGADKVIFPEVDMGEKLAKSLVFENVLDYMDIDENHTIFDMRVPSSWVGKNMIDLQIRNKFSMNVVAVKKDKHFEVPADPNKEFSPEDIIVVAGKIKDIQKVAKGML
ncbi:MAG: TrkA family potassium uptake protein [Peptostreptococcus sp.]|uniref:potassium channel family protein n=1 Tax=Peptostreptococcus sp. TaxID=1262 RepID=UPI0029019CE4|nr:TrkA family potassium uptake protein [Peptostreptococcus sp.]MDU1264516.1 TrkA family potassium uptake protein [Peptostreptococcus sp.]